METKENVVRIEWADIFRGFGILIMIMGHVIGLGNKYSHFIHAFHMPMFFFTSGFFFQYKPENTFGQYIRKKCRNLLVPYSFFGIFHYVIWYWKFENDRSISPLLHLLFVNTEGLPIAGALWFLTALFLTNIIYFIITHYIKNNVIRNILVLVIAFGGNVATRVLPFRMPYALDAAMVGVGLFHIGYLFRSCEGKIMIKKVMNLPKAVCLLWAVFIALLIFVNGEINMRNGEYSIIPLFWINAIGAIIVGINISKYIVAWKNKCKLFSAFCELIMRVGKNSIVYVCLNEIIILFVSEQIGTKVISGRLLVIFLFTVSFVILLLLDVIINNTKLKILIGK